MNCPQYITYNNNHKFNIAFALPLIINQVPIAFLSGAWPTDTQIIMKSRINIECSFMYVFQFSSLCVVYCICEKDDSNRDHKEPGANLA